MEKKTKNCKPIMKQKQRNKNTHRGAEPKAELFCLFV
jgi:hypothetical protein